jgi:hypothetical protein
MKCRCVAVAVAVAVATAMAMAMAMAMAVAVAELMCISLCSTCQPMSAEMSSTPDYENDSPGGVEPHACASGAPLRGSGLDLFLAPERQLSGRE